MNYFLKANKNFLTYSLIILVIIPVFGINFFLSLLGNIILLLLILIFVGFNSYKSKLKTCNNCGSVSINLSETCMNCGADLNNLDPKSQKGKKPSERTIEIKAEEIK